MTIDEAVKKIPDGWRLRLTCWEDEYGSGWGAELYHKDSRRVTGDAETAEWAILSAINEIKKLERLEEHGKIRHSV